MTISWVDDEKATSTARAPMDTSPCDVPTEAIPKSPMAMSDWVSSIQLRRRPSQPITGASRRSTTGAHKNFREYASPTHDRKPIACRVVPWSRSQYPRVLPVRKKGRPDEKPSISITATFGWRSEARTVRLLAGRVAVVDIEGCHLTSLGQGSSVTELARLLGAVRRAVTGASPRIAQVDARRGSALPPTAHDARLRDCRPRAMKTRHHRTGR